MAKKKKQPTSKKRPKRVPTGPRPIDRKRDSAGSIDINPPNDDSPITGMIGVDDQFFVIKERGVYRVTLADEIDPERKNPSIPNTVQRVLGMGSDSELIGKTLLTAQNLFKQNYLPKEVDCDRAVSLTLTITRDLVSMSAAADSFRDEEEKTVSESKVTRRKDGSVIIPDVGVIEAKCKAFLIQAGHVQRELLEIVKLFYRKRNFRKWFDSLAKHISETAGEDDEFLSFINQVLPLLRFVREARNCVEHPKEDQYVKVVDFFINSAGQLVAPTIEVVHPTSRLEPTSASEFMRQITDELVTTVELMLGSLSGRHVQPVAGFQFLVCYLPEDKRQYKHVRLGYALVDGDSVIPAS